MAKQQTIAIIHFNTPEVTEACILSIRKQGCDWPIVVFDNSRKVTWPAGEDMPERNIEAHPFTRKMKGVKVIDNTKGQVIDFESTLAAFPNKLQAHAAVNGWGSDCHMMTVDKLFDLLPDGFILVESDVLVKADITTMWREEYSFCAYVQRQQLGNKFGMGRILPMLCYLNVPKFKAEGVRYFDPDRSWMLHPDENDKRNWYDTGASLLEDVLAHRPRLKGLHVDIRPMVEHLGGGSYKRTGLREQAEWLTQHRALWESEGTGDKIASQKTKPADEEKLSKPKTQKRTNSKSK